jgi:hypothetical protein
MIVSAFLPVKFHMSCEGSLHSPRLPLKYVDDQIALTSYGWTGVFTIFDLEK